MNPKTKLNLALVLLCLGTLPVPFRWPSELSLSMVQVPDSRWAVVVWTLALAALASYGGRVLWAVTLTRILFHCLLALLTALALPRSLTARASLPMLLGSLLLIPTAALWLGRDVRQWVKGRRKGEAAPAAMATPQTLLAVTGVALALGGLEQLLLYAHVSPLEVGLRALYAALPVYGALLLSRLYRHGLWAAAIGALIGDAVAELISQISMGYGEYHMTLNLLILHPLASLLAAAFGASLLAGIQRSLVVAGIGTALAFTTYRTATMYLLTARTFGPVGMTLSLLAGALLGVLLQRLIYTADLSSDPE